MWMIGVRADSAASDLKRETAECAVVYDFPVPAEGLRVGTLDSLMSLSDDLTKMDVLAEATVSKMYKQLVDLKPDEPPTIIGIPVAAYTTGNWAWDEAKFQLKAPLRELSENISSRIGALDEELKLKVGEVNALKTSLAALDRKTQGNLMVRGLADLVGANDCVESEYMTTVFAVVPKASAKDFETSYEKMATYVVPRSGKLISEDSEYSLFAVTIFKKSLDEFKTSAREKRITLREFTYDAAATANDAAKKSGDTHEYERLKGVLASWCHINYAEVYTMQLHLKAVRIFVESVLRYGLTNTRMGMAPNFKSFLLQPKRAKGEVLRKVLSNLYGGSSAMLSEGDEETAVPGATGEFYPYVFTSIETEPNLAN